MRDAESDKILALEAAFCALRDVASFHPELYAMVDKIRVDPDTKIDTGIEYDDHLLRLVRQTVQRLNEALKPSRHEWDRELKASLNN